MQQVMHIGKTCALLTKCEERKEPTKTEWNSGNVCSMKMVSGCRLEEKLHEIDLTAYAIHNSRRCCWCCLWCILIAIHSAVWLWPYHSIRSNRIASYSTSHLSTLHILLQRFGILSTQENDEEKSCQATHMRYYI